MRNDTTEANDVSVLDDRSAPHASVTDDLSNRQGTDNAIVAGEEELVRAARKNDKPPSWSDLPKRQQLVIITLARLSEPLTQTSLLAYLFYQLKWFDPTAPDSTISWQAGVLQASFNAAQFVTAMLWGRIADSQLAGRKPVIMIGLFGTAISCIGFGFSTSFWQALTFRIIGGMTNGNIAVMRTMISEIIREKKYQSRAFLLLPMTFNIGVIIGPILGGVLSDPAGNYPSLFGDIDFFVNYPYATPNLLSAVFLTAAGFSVWLGLDETLEDGPRDYGRKLGKWLSKRFRKSHADIGYTVVPAEPADDDLEMSSEGAGTTKPPKKRYTQRLPFRRIFSRNVSLTLVSQFLLAFHVGAFNSLWFTFLSTPVYDPNKAGPKPEPPLHFTGGIGMPPRTVGIATACLGIIGIALQLGLYPRVSHRLGTVKSLRLSLLCFPVAYILAPFLSILPSTSPPPSAKSGPVLWLSILGILLIHVSGRTFSMPSQAILVNNCSPHPSVLGSVHGVAQSVGSAARTIGPIFGGFVYGQGLEHGIVGAVFWSLSLVAMLGAGASLLLREGNGHEIWLEGDEPEEGLS